MTTTMQVNVSVLNVREEPSVMAQVLTQLKMGQQVSAGVDEAGWTAVEFDRYNGFVASRYLSPPDHSDTGGGTKDLSITFQKLKTLAPGGVDSILSPMVGPASGVFAKYGITTELRICHFFAQTAEESDGFRTLVEYGGPSYFAQYDNRPDLGNIYPGDGYKFRGRSVIQLTGRANYEIYGGYLGIDLVNNPDLAIDPQTELMIAGEFWSRHGLNSHADADDIVSITRIINGGLNGLSNRQIYLARAKTIW